MKKDDSSNLSLLFTHVLKKAWKNERVNSKIFFKIHFRPALLGQTQSHIVRNFSSNINEVFRTVLNFLFFVLYQKISQAQKTQKRLTSEQN